MFVPFYVLQLIDPPKIDITPSAQPVVEGNGTTLFCNATGNPPPSIAWTKQGSITVLSSSETLTLTNLMREDNGAVYRCKVKNNVGSAEATATITVWCEYSEFITLLVIPRVEHLSNACIVVTFTVC